jgi:hypothetical protein
VNEQTCAVKDTADKYDIGYIIVRTKDEADRTIGLHMYVQDPDQVSEIDAFLVEWEEEERLKD